MLKKYIQNPNKIAFYSLLQETAVDDGRPEDQAQVFHFFTVPRVELGQGLRLIFLVHPYVRPSGSSSTPRRTWTVPGDATEHCGIDVSVRSNRVLVCSIFERG